MDALVALVESLDERSWRLWGANFPERVGDEDEGRTVAVICDHVADMTPLLMERAQATAEGRVPPPVDFGAINRAHAQAHPEPGRDEVLRRLRAVREEVGAAIRSLTDGQLEMARETPVGRMTVRDSVERVLIGHVDQHRSSVERSITSAG